MATTSAAALAATPPPLSVTAPPSRGAVSRRVLHVVDRVNAFLWGDAKSAVEARRHAEIARLAGPVAEGAHLAPTPPADKRSALVHYRDLAEQVARERGASGVATLSARRVSGDA